MNTLKFALLVLGVVAARELRAQNVFVYDQPSAVEGARAETGGSLNFAQPYGQSFTPTLDTVGFIRLRMRDLNAGNDLGAAVYVNLRATSITGPILGTSDTVALSDGFGGPGNPAYPDFFFSTPVPVTPGVSYYFQPIVQTGDNVFVFADTTYRYSNGIAFYQGNANPFHDVWFREGTYTVPEPSTIALLVFGIGALAWRVRARRRKTQEEFDRA